MPEIALSGANAITFPQMATWGWEVALYLFLGGLVAGLLVFSGGLELLGPPWPARTRLWTNLAGLVFLAAGMLLLWVDLTNRWNAWRFFTTFQVQSPMSWGSWILLLAMVVLALRALAQLPAPLHGPVARPRRFAFLRRAARAVWGFASGIGGYARGRERGLAVAAVVLGVGLGFYTGVLLSSIAARPLWSSAVLAPLFLVSGLTSGAAWVCLTVPSAGRRIAPATLLLCGVELLLVLAFVTSLALGGAGGQQALGLLIQGSYAPAFWGLVVLAGLLIPAGLEWLELSRPQFPALLAAAPPVLKLTGGLALRFVVVYAGLASFA